MEPLLCFYFQMIVAACITLAYVYWTWVLLPPGGHNVDDICLISFSTYGFQSQLLKLEIFGSLRIAVRVLDYSHKTHDPGPMASSRVVELFKVPCYCMRTLAFFMH